MSSFAPDSESRLSTSSRAFGPYELQRELRPSGEVERHLALHPEIHTHHVAYRFRLGPSETQRQRFLSAIERNASLDIPHLLRVEQFALTTPTEAWVICPYTGNHDGLMLLSDLLAVKGGRMEPLEVARVLSQLLEAIGAAHNAGIVHGPVARDQILVDRSGSLDIELYGIGAALTGPHDTDELAREELMSVVRIAYQLLTGVEASEVLIEPSRLVEKLDREWDAFFAECLDPAGAFVDAQDVLDLVPGRRPASGALEIKTRTVTAFGFGRRKKSATRR